MDARFQVIQFVAVVKGDPPLGCQWAVFITGDAKYYLFSQLRKGCFTGLTFPVAKKDLRADIRKALAKGHGNTTIETPA